MALCNVYGTIQTPSEIPVVGAVVYAVIEISSAISSTGAFAISPLPISTVTTSSGYFSLSLMQNIFVIVTIPCIGYREIIRIPAESSANLFNLSDGIIINTSTGGTTPTPSAEENW